MTAEEIKAVADALAVPFDPSEVKWKPQAVSGNRCLAICYVDARVIQDRLDEVLGVMGWQDSYECLPDGAVVCRLRIRIDSEWIEKMDVGSPSEQPDEGDRRKASFSDALKRAAVKFGIGRYLYRLGGQWVDYDPAKKKIVTTPRLPPEALPPPDPDSRPVSAGPARPAKAAAPKVTLPADGAELLTRLRAYEERLIALGVCAAGDLIGHVRAAGTAAGYPPDLTTWTEPAILLAVEETRVFEARRREPGRVEQKEEGQRLTPEEHRELDLLCRRKQCAPANVAAHLGIKGRDKGLADLLRVHYKSALAYLRGLPDPQPAGAAR